MRTIQEIKASLDAVSKDLGEFIASLPGTSTPQPETPTPVVDEGLIGFGAGTTGGEGGLTVTVTSFADLKAQLAKSEPLIVKVQGMIKGDGTAVDIKPHKTILGVGKDSGFEALGLRMIKSHNVIIRNLTFKAVKGPTDKIGIESGSRHFWIDHCDFVSDLDHGKDYYDGQLDIKRGSNFGTISWCKFRLHAKNSLVGHSDDNGKEDIGFLKVTYHHNLFEKTGSRNPSVRFGTAHVFNNYYLNCSEYGVASRMGAVVFVENNHFEGVKSPIVADRSLSKEPGSVSVVSSNLFKNCGPNSILLPEVSGKPPYSYKLDAAEAVAGIVMSGAGPK